VAWTLSFYMFLKMSRFSEAFSVGHGRGLQGKCCFSLHIPILVMILENYPSSSGCVQCLCYPYLLPM
jgi:hypothetical protein